MLAISSGVESIPRPQSPPSSLEAPWISKISKISAIHHEIVKQCRSSPIFFAIIKKLVLLSYQRQPWSFRRVGVVQLVSWLIQGTLTKVSGGVGWLAGISILDQLARSKYFHGSLQEDFGDFLKNKTFVLQGGIPSLRTNHCLATHLPKGPYWEKYISEFSMVGKL